MNGRSRCEIHPAFEVLFHAYLPFNSGLSSWTFCSVHFSERWRFLFFLFGRTEFVVGNEFCGKAL